MPVNAQEVLNVVTTLTEERNLRVAVKETMKGGILAGASTMVGGLLLGPPGLAIGGIIGACTASYMAHNKFRSVANIIMYDMTPRQKALLVASVNAVLQDLTVEDGVMLLTLVMNSPQTQAAVLSAVTNFITREMSLQIID